MGLSFSCPFVEYGDVENELESVVVKSISFGDDKVKTPVRSVSFKRQDSIPTILTSFSYGKMIIEGSVSFKGGADAMISINPSSLDKENNVPISPIKTMSNDVNDQFPRSDSPSGTCQPLLLEPSYPEHEAAIRLQKVYKSFRTRRKLADCAVLVEQNWWKLLDFAKLKRSSVSFFDITKHESAISRWSRARTRAAKVGKGLSKNDRAQKMALQHWLEAIDPRHRYGHNLHLYYVKWLDCQSREPFFYWLDIGEGKEVVHHKCPRLILQQQCIKYLGPMGRKDYEVSIRDGKFLYKKTGEFLHTTRDLKWIFVLSASKILYAGKKKKGTFQHSSFLAGGATIAAGRLVVENGILKAVWPHSGHYRPTEENFRDFVSFLKENNVDLTYVQLTSIDEEEDSTSRQQSINHARSNSEEYFAEYMNVTETEVVNVEDLTQESIESMEQKYTAALKLSKSRQCRNLSRKLTDLEIPKEDGFLERLQNENSTAGPSCANGVVDSLVGNGYETAEEAYTSDQEYSPLEQNSFEGYEAEVETVPEESILRRINSKKGTNSYQLGKQLSFKWTTGAGPRIGCVRDYPSELQLQALEQVNLSPRRARYCRASSSP